MSAIAVGKVGEIPVGERKIIVPFRGRAGIGIFNVKGAFFALRNICPHKLGPLCTGEIGGQSRSTAPPSVADSLTLHERAGEILRCPWHAWAFDIASGQCLVDPSIRVKTYPIFVAGNNLMMDIEIKDFVDAPQPPDTSDDAYCDFSPPPL